MKEIQLYPYGYIFSDEFIENVPKRYSFKEILGKYKYHYDPIYGANVLEKGDSFIIIHGHFVGISDVGIIEQKELINILLNEFNDNYYKFLNSIDYIGGRYVIIIGSKENVYIYSDATNSRSTYYTNDRLVISSHSKLIQDNFKYEKRSILSEIVPLDITFNITPFENIFRVVPNYYVDMNTHKIHRFFPRENNRNVLINENKKLEKIEFLWKKELEFYNQTFDDLVLSLTGGNDSRISLAMAKDYNKDIKFFTYSTKEGYAEDEGHFAKTLSIDQNIVKQILEDIELNHRFFFFDNSPGVLSKHSRENLDKNTITKHGRYILPHYMNAFPNYKTMHIRANLLEIASCYFHKVYKPNSLQSVKTLMKNSLKKYTNEENKNEIEDIISEILDALNYGEGTHDYHILDLYYWENRMGGWYPEVLNETDAAFDTFLPFNMRAIIDISLSFDIKLRRKNYIFKELVNRNHQILNFYGRNEIKNLYEKIRDTESKSNNLNKPIFKKSFIKDKDDNVIHKLSTSNKLFIPKEYIKKGNFCESSIIFDTDLGIAKFDIDSRFFSTKGKKYLKYEIFKNDQLLLTEDIADWNKVNSINIFNLMKNDIIKIRVTALKNASAESWERASTILINEYTEIKSKIQIDKGITCTSPFANLSS